MEHSTLTLIIIAIATVSFALNKIPLSITAALAVIVMGALGILSFADVYGGFSTTPVILAASMMVVGKAIFDNGLAEFISAAIIRWGFIKNEKIFLMSVLIFGSIFSGFVSNSAVVATLVPLIQSVSANSGGIIENKNIIYGSACAAITGGICTLATTPQLIANSIFIQTPGLRALGYFEYTKVGIFLIAFMLIYFYTIGYRIQKKVFTFTDLQCEVQTKTQEAIHPQKRITTLIILILTVLGFSLGIWNIAMVSFTAATLLLATGCLTFEKAFACIDWNAIVLLACVSGFALGMEKSGAGLLIANAFVSFFGNGTNAWVMFAVFFVMTVILTGFMSNSATIAMVLPIVLSIASAMDANALTFGIGVVVASQIDFSTPVGTPPMTQALVGGYRYTDYLKIGIPITVCMSVISIVAIPLIFGL